MSQLEVIDASLPLFVEVMLGGAVVTVRAEANDSELSEIEVFNFIGAKLILGIRLHVRNLTSQLTEYLISLDMIKFLATAP